MIESRHFVSLIGCSTSRMVTTDNFTLLFNSFKLQASVCIALYYGDRICFDAIAKAILLIVYV